MKVKSETSQKEGLRSLLDGARVDDRGTNRWESGKELSKWVFWGILIQYAVRSPRTFVL